MDTEFYFDSNDEFDYFEICIEAALREDEEVEDDMWEEE